MQCPLAACGSVGLVIVIKRITRRYCCSPRILQNKLQWIENSGVILQEAHRVWQVLAIIIPLLAVMFPFLPMKCTSTPPNLRLTVQYALKQTSTVNNMKGVISPFRTLAIFLGKGANRRAAAVNAENRRYCPLGKYV